MAESKQLAILRRMTSHLETITPGNRYAHDLTGRVYRGRSIFGSEEAVPFLSLLESPRPDDLTPAVDDDALMRLEDWRLLVQGFASEDRQNPTDPLYALKADVERCLSEIVALGRGGEPASPETYMLGGLISGLKIGPGVVRPATPQVGGVEAFYLPLVVQFAMDLRNPYQA